MDIPSIGDDLLTCVQEERNENDKNVLQLYGILCKCNSYNMGEN